MPRLSPPRVEGRIHDALCLGLNACDHLALVSGPPPRGGKLEAGAIVIRGGGQAATCACALARLGWRTAYAGVRGDDEAGERAVPWLLEFGVDPAGMVLKPGRGSQQALILVEEPGGERTIIWHRDPACRLEPADLDPELIAGARVLHLDGHFLEASLEAARIARRHGVLVSLDGERVYPGSEKLVELCQVVVGCEDYPQRLTGIDDPQKSLEELARMGPLWAGRTLGAAGAEMLVGGERLRRPAFAVKTVDTTGAGDVFHAGLIHAILLGRGPEEALETGCALAAMSVTALGGRSNLAERAALEAFLAERS